MLLCRKDVIVNQKPFDVALNEYLQYCNHYQIKPACDKRGAPDPYSKHAKKIRSKFFRDIQMEKPRWMRRW